MPLPAEVTTLVADLVSQVRSEQLEAGGRDVRWVRLDGLHITLRFIGPTLEERVQPALDAVRVAAETTTGFEVSISGAGAFPSAHRPRALWLGIQLGAADLTELARVVDLALEAAGWGPGAKPFAAHLTLARSDGVPAGAAIGAHLADLAADLDIRFRADRIGLYESVTGGGPARYEPLEIAALS